MHKFKFKNLISFVIIVFLYGCASTTESGYRGSDERLLKKQIADLEATVKDKNDQIVKLVKALNEERQKRYALLGMMSEQVEKLEGISETIQRRKLEADLSKEVTKKNYSPFMIKVQTSLRNAGFDPGPIDGKMGKKTTAALKKFQDANKLTPDGEVNEETWELLKKYLNEN